MDYYLSPNNQPKEVYFSPYSQNGGTIVAVAGEDFAVIATDQRLSEGFSILSRKTNKSTILTQNTVLACTGSHNDILSLIKVIQARLMIYEQDNNKKMSTSAFAAMLSTILYYKRFFPYYVYNIVAGLDEEGKGCVYSFDPVGSYEKEKFRAGGTGGAMIQPFLDSQFGYKNQENPTKVPLTCDNCVTFLKDIFISTVERDIYTGDVLNLKIVTKDGIREENYPLRRD